MAVYTDVGDEELEAFMADYGLGEILTCKGIAEGVENSNFLVTTTEGHFILTLYEKRVNVDDLPFFLDLMSHLAAGGVPSPVPVADRAGRVLRELNGRPAALISFLAGMSPKRIQPEHCAELGAGLAFLHLAGADFPKTRPNGLGVSSWRGVLETALPRADELMPGLSGEVEAELDFLEANWPRGLSGGVIHADLFPDNAFFLGGRLSGVIDFYFACNDLIAYDIAVCMNAWCFEADTAFNATKARRLLTGYRNIRNVESEELEAMPILNRGAAMRFLATRLHDWFHGADGFVTPKNPMEYWEKLKFHRRVKGPGAYGLD